MGAQRGMDKPGRLGALCLLLVAAAVAVHATEDVMAAETAQRMANQQELEQGELGTAKADSVVKHKMDAQAAEMLAEEEHSEGDVDQGPDLGESVSSDDDPPAPWVEDEKAQRKADRTHKEEAKIEAVMAEVDREKMPHAPVREAHVNTQDDDDHGDLGESADVQEETGNGDANTLTARAQEPARKQTKATAKVAAMERAKQIADKFRKLVQHQKKLEAISGRKVSGSVLGEAQDARDKATSLQSHDQLLAQKLEDQQAQSAMQHLIHTERTRQQQMFEKERQTTHNLLHSVRHKLQEQQKKMVGSVEKETAAAVGKVENELSKTGLAKTVEDVVKKKLSKRIAELQATGEKTVHDVESQMQALKSRVRRLRREQTRMKVTEAQQGHQQQHRDLGESAGVGNSAMAMEMERMRMEQQMMMQQQRMSMMQQPPRFNSEEHEELLQMKKQMSEMKKQNAMLQQLVTTQASARLSKLSKAESPHYTHQGLEKYFQHKHLNAALLKKDVLAEQRRLRESSRRYYDEVEDSQSLLQLSEGADDPATTTALPPYNQRAEQARVESEELKRRALADALAM